MLFFTVPYDTVSFPPTVPIFILIFMPVFRAEQRSRTLESNCQIEIILKNTPSNYFQTFRECNRLKILALRKNVLFNFSHAIGDRNGCETGTAVEGQTSNRSHTIQNYSVSRAQYQTRRILLFDIQCLRRLRDRFFGSLKRNTSLFSHLRRGIFSMVCLRDGFVEQNREKVMIASNFYDIPCRFILVTGEEIS